tara:strand:- start:3501 stop:4022 length:522 start_codon:yes stop_codon:yes gene_type:complete
MKKKYRKKNKEYLKDNKNTIIYQDTPTTEQLKKNVYDWERLPTQVQRARILNQTLLDTYLLKHYIDQTQYDAGFKYYTLWRKSNLEPNLVIKYDPIVQQNNNFYSGSSQGECYVELNQARKAIGKRLSSVVDNVCLYNNPLSIWEKNYNVKAKTGMTAFILALDSLIDYWGMN